jgi:hypothetical protein
MAAAERYDFKYLNFGNYVESVGITCVCKVDSHKGICNSIRITSASFKSVAEVGFGVWNRRDTTAKNDEASYAYAIFCKPLILDCGRAKTYNTSVRSLTTLIALEK